MLISELIGKLQETQAKIGDCEIYTEEPAQGSPNYGTPELKIVPYQQADGSPAEYVVIT